MLSPPPAFSGASPFFTFSALLHLILVVVGGSVVLSQIHVTAPDFEAGESFVMSSDTADAQKQDEPQIQEISPAQVTSPQSAAPSIAVLTATSTTTAFALNAAPMSKLDGKLTGLGDAGKALGDKLAGAGAGMGKGGGVKGGTMRFFGMKEKTAPSLVGTFYDLKQTRGKKPTGISPDEYHKVFRRFVAQNWRDSILNEYFKAPQPLYSTQIMIPNMEANEGPKAFGMEKEVQPSRSLVHYKAKVSPPADGTYHFVGAGDDVMIVRFNGKVVLDRCWYQQDAEWQPERNYSYGWTGIPNGFAKGDPVRVKAGQFYDMEVLIGEQPGGLVFACLLIEQEGREHQEDGKGNPVLPIFRLANLSMPELQKGQTLPPFEPDGPVWKAAAAGGSGFDGFFGPK